METVPEQGEIEECQRLAYGNFASVSWLNIVSGLVAMTPWKGFAAAELIRFRNGDILFLRRWKVHDF